MPIGFRRLLPVAAFALLPSSASVAADPVPVDLPLTPRAAREDLELAISAVEAGIPDLFWHQSRQEWAKAKADARARVASVTDSEALWRILRPLMSRIGEGHLGLRVSGAMTRHYRDATRFPLDVLWTQDGVFVLAGYGEASGIPKGSRLLAIDGEGMPALLDRLFASMPHDGAIRTAVMRDVSGRGLASMLFRLDGPRDRFRIEVDEGGRRVVNDVAAVSRIARPPEADDPSPLPTLEWVRPDTGYLNVPTFSNARLRAAGADFEDAIHTIFQRLRAAGARDLILDLRENGGGSEPNEAILFSYLVDRPLRRYAYVEARAARLSVTSATGKRFDRDVFDADELAEQRRARSSRLRRPNIAPEGLMTRWTRYAPVYSGRLVVLAGGNTFSGGAELASMLRHARRGVFVGEEVGGMYAGNTSGYRWPITLPNSAMTLTVPLLKFRMAWDAVPRDHGVLPDCPVPPNVMEAGTRRDRAWRTALALFDGTWRVSKRATCPTNVR